MGISISYGATGISIKTYYEPILSHQNCVLGEVHNQLILFDVVEFMFDMVMQCLGISVYVCPTSTPFQSPFLTHLYGG